MASTRNLGIVLLGFLLPLAGCSAALRAPGEVSDPRPVFLLDHGRHSTLVLTGEEGTPVRYAYGDWDYYARNRTGPWHGSGAVLWPTRGALGRRELDGPATESGVRRAVAVGVREIVRVNAEGRRVDRLRRRLDTLFEASAGDRVVNRRYDLVFVPHPESYSLTNNSNGKVAEWLETLGVRVSGWPLWSSWRREDGSHRRPGGEGPDP